MSDTVITVTRTVALTSDDMEKKVREFSQLFPDVIYDARENVEQNGCQNTPSGANVFGCIVGASVLALGGVIPAGEDGAGADNMLGLAYKDARWLLDVQAAQDARKPWHVAVAQADVQRFNRTLDARNDARPPGTSATVAVVLSGI